MPSLPTNDDPVVAGAISTADYVVNLAHNKIGIYVDTAGTGASEISVGLSSPFSVYLVVTDPYNNILDQDITAVQGFEFGRRLGRYDSGSASWVEYIDASEDAGLFQLG